LKYKYKIFGYNVASEIKLDAYAGDFDLCDLKIKLGRVNKEDFGIEAGGWWFSNNEKHISFYIPEIGAYEIVGGNVIFVDPDQESKDSEIQLFLLGSAFGFLMHQRGVFPLHGSTVDLGFSCLTIVGHSGAGKSSLASGFVERGFKLLTDDVSRTGLKDGIRHVYPSYPSQKIWKDAVSHMGIDYNPENRILNRFDKFYVNNRERFSEEPQPLKAVIEIYPANVVEPTLIRPEKRDVLNILIAHSYRQEMMGDHTDLRSHLQFCSELAMTVPVYRLLRPLEGFTVREQIRAIGDLLEIEIT
jgi:Serine kinase of the HPr protein, regulates carbohydrate metabolism